MVSRNKSNPKPLLLSRLPTARFVDVTTYTSDRWERPGQDFDHIQQFSDGGFLPPFTLVSLREAYILLPHLASKKSHLNTLTIKCPPYFPVCLCAFQFGCLLLLLYPLDNGVIPSFLGEIAGADSGSFILQTLHAWVSTALQHSSTRPEHRRLRVARRDPPSNKMSSSPTTHWCSLG